MRGLFILAAAAAAAAGASLLGGCAGATDSDTIARCERDLLARLKAPSSYKRIKTFEYDEGGKRHTSIEYDAVNAFNAPLRATEFCVFPIVNGRADASRSLGLSEEPDNLASDADLMTGNLGLDPLPPPLQPSRRRGRGRQGQGPARTTGTS